MIKDQKETQQQMTVFIDKPFYQEIKKAARRKGLSLSSFVRLTLRETLDQQQAKNDSLH